MEENPALNSDERSPYGFKTEFFALNGVRIKTYRRNGIGRPLVFVHGITDSAACFFRTALEFSENELILFDARGHGYSGHSGPYSIEKHAGDIAALQTSVNSDSSVMIGHSMGAVNLAYAAGNGLISPSGLVLEDPPWLENFPREDGLAFISEWKKTVIKRTGMTLKDVEAEGRIEHPGWIDRDYEAWAQSKIMVDPQVMDWLCDMSVYGGWRDYFMKIKCPVLLICGNKSKGAYVSRSLSDLISEQMSNVSIRTFDTGHSVRREDFDGYISAVKDFLNRISRQV